MSGEAPSGDSKALAKLIEVIHHISVRNRSSVELISKVVLHLRDLVRNLLFHVLEVLRVDSISNELGVFPVDISVEVPALQPDGVMDGVADLVVSLSCHSSSFSETKVRVVGEPIFELGVDVAEAVIDHEDSIILVIVGGLAGEDESIIRIGEASYDGSILEVCDRDPEPCCPSHE
jgi:hypothetical protein